MESGTLEQYKALWFQIFYCLIFLQLINAEKFSTLFDNLIFIDQDHSMVQKPNGECSDGLE